MDSDDDNEVSIIYKQDVLGKKVWVKFPTIEDDVNEFFEGVITKMEVSHPDNDTKQPLEYRHYIHFGDDDDGYFDLTDLETTGYLHWNENDAKEALAKEEAERARNQNKKPAARQTSTATTATVTLATTESQASRRASASLSPRATPCAVSPRVVTPVKRKQNASASNNHSHNRHRNVKVKTEPIEPNNAANTSNYSIDPTYETINMDEFQHWLGTVHKGSKGNPISHANFKSVLNRARDLISGRGVTYKNWPAGIKFYGHNQQSDEDKVVDITTNYQLLLQQAKEFEKRYGKDKGNGWLLQHPIKKLMLYQQYVFERRQARVPVELLD